MNRVTKEIAIALKDVGYDVTCDVFYYRDHTIGAFESQESQNFNASLNKISAPTVYEAIEFTDSKGVYVVPFLIYEDLKPKGWGCTITFKNGQYWDWDDEFITEIKDTRLAAYTAGLPIAIDYIKNKEG